MSDRLCFLLADDHSLITQALSMLLASAYPDCSVHAANTASDARDLVSRYASEADLLILDLSMPGVVGTSLLEEFVKAAPELKILVLSGSADRESMMAALQAGAQGFVPKTLDPALLTEAVRFVLNGGFYLPSSLITDSLKQNFFGTVPAQPAPASVQLTPRQNDVLQELAKGNPVKRICRNLNLSEGTVKTHIAAIYRAFGATNRTEALIAARRAGYRINF